MNMRIVTPSLELQQLGYRSCVIEDLTDTKICHRSIEESQRYVLAMTHPIKYHSIVPEYMQCKGFASDRDCIMKALWGSYGP